MDRGDSGHTIASDDGRPRTAKLHGTGQDMDRAATLSQKHVKVWTFTKGGSRHALMVSGERELVFCS